MSVRFFNNKAGIHDPNNIPPCHCEVRSNRELYRADLHSSSANWRIVPSRNEILFIKDEVIL